MYAHDPWYLSLLYFLAVPAALAACIVWQVEQTALVSTVIVLASLVPFFVRFERARPRPRDFMPVVVLTALSVTGRLLFAALPNFKPVSAIVILAGVCFGKHSGFLTGALSALVSNLFFGQGPWTPWQMYAWGLVGYLAGVLADRGWLDRTPALLAFGFSSALLYGLLLNGWNAIGFVHPLTLPAVLVSFGAALPFDLMHGAATVAFLAALYLPWKKKLERIKKKYALVPDGGAQ